MEDYEFLGRIGEGAHGVVSKAKHKPSGEMTALKKISLRRLEDGIPNQVLREIKSLQQVGNEPSIVRLRDVFPHGTGFVLVFDYMLSDLSEVIRNWRVPLSDAQTKNYMAMLLKGVAFLHENKILHRDLKPANLLIGSDGRLRIADFGLARLADRDGDRLYSHQVATRWYRAPELLYGARKYDEGVDLWAVGTIFGEMINKSPLFVGSSDIEQLTCVLRALGSPSEESWPGLTQLPDFNKIDFPHYDPVDFREILPEATADALALVEKFLVYDTKRRLSAKAALVDDYFFTAPAPLHDSELPIPQRMTKKLQQQQQLHNYSLETPLEDILPPVASLRHFVNTK